MQPCPTILRPSLPLFIQALALALFLPFSMQAADLPAAPSRASATAARQVLNAADAAGLDSAGTHGLLKVQGRVALLSPDGTLRLSFSSVQGEVPTYQFSADERTLIENSPLGLVGVGNEVL